MQAEAFEASRLVIRAFEELEVPYLVGGSLASSFHGIPRSTMDVDIVADLKLAHAHPLAARLEGDYYVDSERILQAVRNRSSFNVIYLKTMFKVDVFVLKDEPLAREGMRRRRRVEMADGQLIDVATAEDTLLQKLIWYRLGGETSERQWSDVLGVLKVSRDQLDLDYMQRWAERMQLEELWQRAVSEAGRTQH